MAVQILPRNNGKAIQVAVTGTLHKEVYESLTTGKVRLFERAKKDEAKQWLLVES